MKPSLMIALLVACEPAACQPQTTPPEVAAQKFVDDLGITIQGKPNCTGVDTDNDGYVTCTLRVGDHFEQLQCAALKPTGCETGPAAEGCKQKVAWR